MDEVNHLKPIHTGETTSNTTRRKPEDQLAADRTTIGRDLSKVKDLADRGVQPRAIDFDDPGMLRAAVRGAGTVLPVSRPAGLSLRGMILSHNLYIK